VVLSVTECSSGHCDDPLNGRRRQRATLGPPDGILQLIEVGESHEHGRNPCLALRKAQTKFERIL
jgi:hypothetical protein